MVDERFLLFFLSFAVRTETKEMKELCARNGMAS